VRKTKRTVKEEDTYATVRGPGYVPSYDRHDGPGTGNFHADAMSIVVPQNPALGKLWVFHPSFLDRDSAVDLALLAKGYYIVLPPISFEFVVSERTISLCFSERFTDVHETSHSF
jgi:hypothetical protein